MTEDLSKSMIHERPDLPGIPPTQRGKARASKTRRLKEELSVAIDEIYRHHASNGSCPLGVQVVMGRDSRNEFNCGRKVRVYTECILCIGNMISDRAARSLRRGSSDG